MSDLPQRFDHIRRWARVGRLLAVAGAVYLLVLVGGVLLLRSGSLAEGTETGFARALIGIAVLGGGVLGIAGLIFLRSLVELVLKIEANSFRIYDTLRDISTTLEEHGRHLKSVAENSQLSEVGRDVTHRGKERTALRLAINEEIIRGDWEAAYALVERLEARHGYRNEATRLREEIDQSRERAKKDEVHDAVEQVRALMSRHLWDQARREMDHLLAEQGGDTEVKALPALFSRLRDEHKRHLLKRWDEAVTRSETDRGIEILRELDQYLTPSEAAALEESARGVFRAKLHNLGVRFSLAVTDRDWPEALAAGRQIVQEFPNSQMAQEVKQRIHVLAARAEEASPSTAAGTSRD